MSVNDYLEADIMMNTKLGAFIESLLDRKEISPDDLLFLQNVVLPEGISNRHEADALLALDRILTPCRQWTNILISLIVNYVLTGDKREGRIDRETAHWLISSLDVGEINETAARIAQDVIVGASIVDPVLIDFVLQRVRRFSRNNYEKRSAA